jgi:hypothetical protein
LNKADKNGVTEREHLEQVRKQTGYAPEGLENSTKFPNLLSHVWSFFLQLHQSRTMGFSGPNPITYSEMESWVNLTNNKLHPYDVGIIKRLDSLYMQVQNG